MTQEFIDLEQRREQFTEHLRVITSGLIEMAKAIGRERYTPNQLLRECYDLVGYELHTLEEWHELGRYVKEREHGYLFWKNGEVELLYSQFQLTGNKDYEL